MKKPPKPADDEPIGPEERDRLFARLEGRRLALCVSGGADSMALMHLVAEWAKARRRPDVAHRRPPVIVLTVDHGLRPESADEARFVAHEASKLDLPHETLVWEGEKPASGVQEAARDARRRLLFSHVIDEAEARLRVGDAAGGAGRVLVMAHHLEDQAETFLMRLARGSGIEGLSGMRPFDLVAPERSWGLSLVRSVGLARPLLGVSRGRLRATLDARAAPWIEDPSNEDERFERVRVRSALALLAEVGVTSEKIAVSSRRLREAADFIAREGPELASERRSHVALWSGPVLAFDACQGLLGVCRFKSLNRYLRIRTLRQMLLTFGGASVAPELGEIEALVDWIETEAVGQPSGGRTLGGAKVVVRADGYASVIVYRELGALDGRMQPLHAGEPILWDGGRFSVSAAVPGIAVGPLGRDGWAHLKREVLEVAGLGLPADSMATAPAFFMDGDRLVGCPPLGCYIERPSAQFGYPADLDKLQRAWKASPYGNVQQDFRAELRPAGF